MQRLLLVMLAVSAAACERRGAVVAPECDANEVGIGDSTLGPLHIDEALPALRVRCAAVADTTVTVRMIGWTDSVRALRLVVRGAPALILHDSSKVTAVRVESPVFRTNDSLGVGTSIARFKNLRGIRVSQSSHPPRVILLDRRRCGVTYELSSWGGAPPLTSDDPPLTGARIVSWPDTIVVSAVTVDGCRGATRDLGIDSISEVLSDSAARADSIAMGQTAPMQPLAPPDAAPLPAMPSPTPAPRGRADTSAIVATSRDLVELTAMLDVPVQGVPRSRLRDTYAEPRGGRVHEALDIPAARGTPVLSAADGTLQKLFDSKAGGLMVYAGDPTDRFVLLYGHLDRYADGLREGMPLKRGQVIGYVGTTGNAPLGTPHLHFAIMRGRPSQSWWRGTPVNPYPLLAEKR
jgi:hypothetical protein